MRREILRSGSVGFRLALFWSVHVRIIVRGFRRPVWLRIELVVLLGSIAEQFRAVVAGAVVRDAVLRFADGLFVMCGCAA